MPNYTYKSKDPSCEGFEAFQKLSDPELRTCPRCGAPVYRAITMRSAGFKFSHASKGDMRDYRDDLARFAGDPEAFTDGPRAVRKLIDKRKREGWQIGRSFDTPTMPKLKTSQEVAAESFKRAKAKGFVPDAPSGE